MRKMLQSYLHDLWACELAHEPQSFNMTVAEPRSKIRSSNIKS
jgi:hypothetical protein